MRFTRHARRRMKLYQVTPEDAARVATDGDDDGIDGHGNPRRVGTTSDGRSVRVIMALDVPDTIITVYERRKR